MDTDNIKTEWDLSLLYENPEEGVEADIEDAKEAYESFAQKYREDKSYLEDPEALKEALEELEYLGGEKNLGKPLHYFNYRKDLNANDQQAESKMNQLSQLYSKLGNKIRFFELELGNLPEDKKEEFLNSPELKHYHKYLRWTFKTAQYNLEEKEENILSLTSLPRSEMWKNGVQKAINQRTVELDGEEIPLPKAFNKLKDLPTEKRRALHNLCMDKVLEIKEFAESELNALVTDKKISDELRGYDKPYSARAIGTENSQEEVETLVETVTQNFDIAQRFYQIKANILGEDILTYADRNAAIGSIGEDIEFANAVEMVNDAFEKLDPQFQEVFHSLFTHGQVDVFPEEGKTGGAHCSSSSHLPTYILLNYVDNFDSVTTLAHEAGHAVHGELAKQQTPIYEDYSLAVAETASTFFEAAVFNEVFQSLNQKDKVIALHDKINSTVSTVFRQIACFNFEKDLHAKIRESGSLSHDDIAELMNENMQAYLGDTFELKKKDGYFFISWPHLRRPFYVYTYAYGDLISNTLHEKIVDDSSYVSEIKKLLSAGSSQPPEKLFADIGIDTTSTDVFEQGLSAIESDIDKLEEMAS